MTVRRHGRGWVLAALLVFGAEVAAQSPADGVIEQLREQGYVEFEVSRTLLRRIRVVAFTPDGGRREIVFNPATGEILRDYYEAADGASAPMIFDRPEDDTEASRPPGASEGDGRNGLSRNNGGAAPQRDEDDRPGGSGGEVGSRRTGQAAGRTEGARPGIGP